MTSRRARVQIALAALPTPTTNVAAMLRAIRTVAPDWRFGYLAPLVTVTRRLAEELHRIARRPAAPDASRTAGT